MTLFLVIKKTTVLDKVSIIKKNKIKVEIEKKKYLVAFAYLFD